MSARGGERRLRAAPPTEPPVKPTGGLSIDEMRRRMLFRGDRAETHVETPTESEANSNRDLHTAVFAGRALVFGANIPSQTSHDTSDPQKLFQMLRRRKKHATNSTFAERTSLRANGLLQPGGTAAPPFTPAEHNSARSSDGKRRAGGSAGSPHSRASSEAPIEPATNAPASHPADGPPAATEFTRPRNPPRREVQRPAYSARPVSPTTRRPLSGVVRAIHSAHAGAVPSDGRPCTRQKHPKQALDLFPKSKTSTVADELFPAKPQPRRGSTDKMSHTMPATGSKRGDVNFNCLFVSGDDDLEGTKDEFMPSPPKPPVKIPLIETDWFTEGSFEQLPVTDDEPVSVPPAAEEDEGSHSQLFEMLVAQSREKHRRHERRGF